MDWNIFYKQNNNVFFWTNSAINDWNARGLCPFWLHHHVWVAKPSPCLTMQKHSSWFFLGAKLASHILENEAGQISQVRNVAMWNSCLCLCLSAPFFAQTFRKRIMFDTWMRAACMVWSAHVTFCHNARKQFGFRNLCDFLCLCKRLIWITFLQGIIECSPQ